MQMGDVWVHQVEYTFYPPFLPAEGVRRLKKIVKGMTTSINGQTCLQDEPGVQHCLMTLDEFIRLFYRLAYDEKALVVGFNLPFDLSRLACGWVEARSKWYAGGFSLKLMDYRPNIAIRNIDSKRAFIGFVGGKDPQKKRKVFKGSFLDLRTLVFALTSKAVKLDKACEMFKISDGKMSVDRHGLITPEYVRYNRQDVKVTAELAVKLLPEFDKHPISREHRGTGKAELSVSECKVYSPASIVKAYFRAMGISLPDIPSEVDGYTMAGYYGGRTEVRIRKVEVPVAYLDFRSMYPTVHSLMGLWNHCTADSIEIQDATEEVRNLLARADPSALFEQKTWRELNAIVLVRPQGTTLPVRARYSPHGSWKIGINPYHSERELWYALPDVMAAKLIDSETPNLIKALRFVPTGKREGLAPVNFGGIIDIDPAQGDLFAAIVEQRIRVKKGLPPYDRLSDTEREWIADGLKTFANSGSYGVFAEMNQNPAESEGSEAILYGNDGSFICDSNKLEEAGEFLMPHIATLVTAGARLMLALLYRCVTDCGGVHVFTDTDSMAVVSTEAGELVTIPAFQNGKTEYQHIKALSWEQVDAIAARFESLNPFDPTLVSGSILELKEHNFNDTGERIQLYAHAISPKRYVMYGKNREPITDIQSSLGYLVNPANDSTEWIADVWHCVATGGDVRRLPFSKQLAVRRLSITSPEVLERLKSINADKPYSQQIKPFNFGLTLSEHYLFRRDDEPASLIAPYELDPAKWQELPWLDSHSGERVTLATPDGWFSATPGAQEVRPMTFGDVLARYVEHPEPTFLAFDGSVCNEDTTGLLFPRPVELLSLVSIGKETNELRHRLADSGLDTDEPTEYGTDNAVWCELVLPVIGLLPKKEVAVSLGVTVRTIERWLSGEVEPSDKDKRRAIRRLDALLSDKLTLLDCEPGDVMGNLTAFPVALSEKAAMIEHTMRELVQQHGQRTTAKWLGIAQSTLCNYQNGGLPKDIPRMMALAVRLSQIQLYGAMPFANLSA